MRIKSPLFGLCKSRSARTPRFGWSVTAALSRSRLFAAMPSVVPVDPTGLACRMTKPRKGAPGVSGIEPLRGGFDRYPRRRIYLSFRAKVHRI
jgi:hypothetical protein